MTEHVELLKFIGASDDEIARADFVLIVPPDCHAASGNALRNMVVVEAHMGVTVAGLSGGALRGKSVRVLSNEADWLAAICATLHGVGCDVSAFNLGEEGEGGAGYVAALPAPHAFSELAKRGVLRRMIGNCRAWSPAAPAGGVDAPKAAGRNDGAAVATNDPAQPARANERALALALRYAAAGLRTFPCQTDSSPVPGFNDWNGNASADADTLRRWYLHDYADSAAMVGLPGGANGLVILDLDVPSPRKPHRKDGRGAFMALVGNVEAEQGPGLLNGAPLVDTPSGGRHVIFTQPRDGTVIGNSSGDLPPGVDVKGVGGYVIAAGSVRDDGAYAPVPGAPDLLDAFRVGLIPPLPDALAALIRTQKTGEGDKAEPGRVYIAPDVLAEAVACIDNPPDGWCDRDEWFRLANAFAILSGGDRDLETTVDEWSHNSPGDHAAHSIFARARRGGVAQGPGPSVGVIGKALKQHPLAGKEARANELASLIVGTVEAVLRAKPGDDFPAMKGGGSPLSGNQKSPNAKSKKLVLVQASQCSPAAMRWLWTDFIPAGKITIFAGPPKLGKTTMALKIAAEVSKGGSFPDGSAAMQGKVLIWSGEDDFADTILPRLMAEGADRDQIHFVKGVQGPNGETDFDPATHLPDLETEIAALGNVALLILDPLVSAVQGDMTQNNTVRRALQPLKLLAERTGVAVVGITHFNKNSKGSSPLDRVNGSVAFGALARAVFFFAEEDTSSSEDPLNPAKLFLRGAGTFSGDGGGWRYSIVPTTVTGTDGGEIKTTRIKIGSPVSGDAKAVLAEAEGVPGNGRDDGAGKVADAIDFLRKYLADGPRTPRETIKTAKDEGLSERTLHRAKKKLGVQSDPRHDGDGKVTGWVWELPTPGDDFEAVAEEGAKS